MPNDARNKKSRIRDTRSNHVNCRDALIVLCLVPAGTELIFVSKFG